MNVKLSVTILIPDDLKASGRGIPGRTTTPGYTSRPARSTPTPSGKIHSNVLICDNALFSSLIRPIKLYLIYPENRRKASFSAGRGIDHTNHKILLWERGRLYT